jgi:hypothetical protein
MKVQHHSFDEERAVLIGMIVDKNVLGRISSKWSLPMFQSSYANKVGQWCIDYFAQYEKAPGHHIQSLFESWASDSRNKDAVETTGQFLDTLNKQYKRLAKDSNSQYVVDLAARYFNRVKLNQLTDAVSGDLIQGKTDKAVGRVVNYHKVEMGVGEGIKVFQDKDTIREAFEEQHDPLITYTDGLGKFFSDRLERDGFIAFQGPEKRGKSFWLLDIAFRAVIQKRRVAFFECGDLSRNQIMRRFMVRVARHPLYSSDVRYPLSIRHKPKHPPIIRVKHKRFKKGLTWRTAYKACKEIVKHHKLKDALRLSIHFNDTLNVSGIRGMLDEWERDGWIPDVIVIDYADILNMDHPGLEGRDRIDHTWKQLRRLSQERHCLVVTATQTAARGYDAITQSQKHFSEDKRKLAHVTGMVGLNQTVKEKEKGIMRLNWIELREGWYSERQCCYVATCFELANMAVKSCF